MSKTCAQKNKVFSDAYRYLNFRQLNMQASNAVDISELSRCENRRSQAKHWFGIKKHNFFFLIIRYLEQLPERLANVLYCPTSRV